jgi:putative transposase
MKQKKAYTYRFYPTDEQKQLLARTFGCCRYVYNWALRDRTDAYYKRGERLSYEDTAQRLVLLKKQEETSWLDEVSSVPLQQALRNLDRAFRHFFEGRAHYPTFKKKRHPQSATYASNAFSWDGKSLTLAKMDEPLAIVWHRPLTEGCQPSSVTITKDEAERYFVSILVEEDIKALVVTPKMVGLDLGLKSMVIESSGQTHGNPKFFAKDEKKLAKAQRRLAKKKKGSKNRAKARLKVARLHKKIADRRRDYQHKLSTKIIRENQVVCIESLQVKNMVKNHSLAKAISDVGWSEFVRQLEYKAEWYGRTLVKIDKWYPSSKRCFDCGHILDSLTLDVRAWTCPQCGVHHDRDINAAKNILAVGLTVAACGEAIRPGAVKTKPGKPPRSRKASQ